MREKIETFYSKSRAVAIVWGMVAVYFVLFTFAALAGSIVTALYGIRWTEMDGQDRFVIKCLIFLNWATVMMAFFNRAITRASAGELPISGDEELIKRPPGATQITQTTSVQQETVATTPATQPKKIP